ncbi:hypothetical protein ACQEVB_03095 [Pseudonocardia sp. CA-107938]|uniref:hypothetical protein n=1 Tax=Pseudonocardia sp. CA-107938 TaxID=3240021 RepID=UPI003D8CA222
MGVLGELFPGRKIQDTSSEAGDGQPFRLGEIDLENNVVQVHRRPPAAPDEDTDAND